MSEKLKQSTYLINEVKKELRLGKAMEQVGVLFNQLYGSFDDSIGVFGRYPSTLHTSEGDIGGEKLIENLGKLFAKKRYIAVTGKGIFQEKDGKVEPCFKLTKEIEKMVFSSPESGHDFSRCLASLPKFAVCILSQDRSSSQKEEEEFLKDSFNSNKLCVGLLFLQEKPRGCKKISNKGDFYVCDIPNFKDCKTIKCPFIAQGGIPAGDVESFIRKDFSKLIITKSYKNIPKIVREIKNV